ncbi:carbohydrate esterase family 16 protein [Oidiodendron maius Zn]|uniref:Carbohydrate esterase family 16 protein n=1 Tax=Oidiodendron maius (strain Zn) TaxID=913774 RepID=A0A0C3HU38_OIDMZ|nr:carbohydrate esterase family 16 protein [Oidiodendron maius Zn]
MKLLLTLLVCCGASLAVPPSTPSFSWKNTNFLLAFGDSYTYVQGTAGLQNFSFIGDLQNFTYTPQQLLSNEIVQNQIGTSAGGPNWVEYLTGCFSGLPSRCKTQLWDFSFAGSDVSVDYTPLHHPYTVSFINQILQWSSFARPVLKPDLSKALVAVWIGINDISDSAKYTFPRNNASDFEEFYNEIITTEFQALETVWKAGYRNYLLMNLPPLERTPGNVIPGAVPSPNKTQVAMYNALISSSASAFAKSHPGTKAMVFDTHTFLSSVLDDPSPYGIKNTTGYCPNYDAPDIATNYTAYGCLPIPEYFWYNTGHITFHVHKILADEVGKFLTAENGNGRWR